jgi:predicted deacylase
MTFDPSSFARGARHEASIDLGFTRIPILLLRGSRPGKTLVVSANVHGDEYEGVRAIYEAVAELDAGSMAGDLIAVPVANPPAFWNGTRTSPLDGANLARVFPGKPDGTPSEQIAWSLAHSVIAHADFYIDLHSGGVRWRMPSMAGYDASDPRSEAGARAFGAAVIWGHPDIAPGRTVSFAKSRGIPFLYTEARGAGRIAPDDLEMMKRGVRNLLRHLAICDGEPERLPLEWHLFGEGNVERGIDAPCRGFLIPAVDLLERVSKGQLLGRLVDLFGHTIEELRSPCEGIVGLRREFPVVEQGEPLFLIAGVIE